MSWLRSRSGPDLPPLPEAPKVNDLPEARLQSAGRYLGTTLDGEPITVHRLGGRGPARLLLSDDALDVVRVGRPLRIPASALRGASHRGDDIVVLWEHGGRTLETTLRLSSDPSAGRAAQLDKQRGWVRGIGKVARRSS